MPADLILMPEVEGDLDEAYAWYEEQRKGKGQDFLNCVNVCIQAILLSPEIRAFCYKHYRKALVSKFPYAV
jgi:hypothetical protein